jgi:hypothetical protein
MFKLNHDPIEVVVSETEYNCYGPTTKRSIRLTAILQNLGGINETVKPGAYHFNVKRRNFKLIASLYPIDIEQV